MLRIFLKGVELVLLAGVVSSMMMLTGTSTTAQEKTYTAYSADMKKDRELLERFLEIQFKDNPVKRSIPFECPAARYQIIEHIPELRFVLGAAATVYVGAMAYSLENKYGPLLNTRIKDTFFDSQGCIVELTDQSIQQKRTTTPVTADTALIRLLNQQIDQMHVFEPNIQVDPILEGSERYVFLETMVESLLRNLSMKSETEPGCRYDYKAVFIHIRIGPDPNLRQLEEGLEGKVETGKVKTRQFTAIVTLNPKSGLRLTEQYPGLSKLSLTNIHLMETVMDSLNETVPESKELDPIVKNYIIKAAEENINNYVPLCVRSVDTFSISSSMYQGSLDLNDQTRRALNKMITEIKENKQKKNLIKEERTAEL